MTGVEETPPDPDRLRPWSTPTQTAPGGVAPPSVAEPILNLPVACAALAGVTLFAFAVQSATGVEGGAERFGFAPHGLARPEGWIRLVTVLFVHGGWGHVLMNTLGLVAFGAPMARLLGRGAGGAAAFFAFYAVCGALSCLGYAAVHPGTGVLLVGASGAVSGLMGGASRLIGLPRDDPDPRLAPMLSSPVLGMAAAWTVVNLLIALVGFSPGAGSAPVAWEAHLFGYAAGLLLVGPTARALGRVRG